VTWRPNRWGAAVLGLLLMPSGFLYVARWRVALLYVVAAITLATTALCVRAVWMVPFIGTALALSSSAHSYVLAARYDRQHRPWYSHWYSIVAVFGGAFAAVVVTRMYFVEPFRSPSGSMEPTIHVGATMLVTKIGFGTRQAYGLTIATGRPSTELHRGELVVFVSPRDPSVVFVKRIVGLPGDKVAYSNKRLSINGKAAWASQRPIDDVHLEVVEALDGATFRTAIDGARPAEDFELKVEDGTYFVLGDNRDASFDSRGFGSVRETLLIGRVKYLLQ
jgi:signal peptidase I